MFPMEVRSSEFFQRAAQIDKIAVNSVSKGLTPCDTAVILAEVLADSTRRHYRVSGGADRDASPRASGDR